MNQYIANFVPVYNTQVHALHCIDSAVLWSQVVANYVAMVPNGKIFDNSLEKGRPYDVRVGAGQVCHAFTHTVCVSSHCRFCLAGYLLRCPD